MSTVVMYTFIYLNIYVSTVRTSFGSKFLYLPQSVKTISCKFHEQNHFPKKLSRPGKCCLHSRNFMDE